MFDELGLIIANYLSPIYCNYIIDKIYEYLGVVCQPHLSAVARTLEVSAFLPHCSKPLRLRPTIVAMYDLPTVTSSSDQHGSLLRSQ